MALFCKVTSVILLDTLEVKKLNIFNADHVAGVPESFLVNTMGFMFLHSIIIHRYVLCINAILLELCKGKGRVWNGRLKKCVRKRKWNFI
jgi:hypothetical protein